LKKINESARARGTVLRFAILGAAVLAALIGAAGRSGAASPVITPSQSSIPGDGVAVAYSGVVAGQSNYVSYTVGFQRGADNNNLSHARVSEPVNCTGTTTTTACTDSGFIGAKVVSVAGTITVGSTTTPFCTAPVGRTGANTVPAIGAEGVTCPIGALASNSTISLTIVFQVPAKSTVCTDTSFDNRAALLVDESINDSQPQSNHQDTFATDGVGMTTLLTCDAANALNSFALPGDAATFQTDVTPGTGNYQASSVSWGGGTPTLSFPGGGLQLFECGRPGSGAQANACDPLLPSPCGGACLTQTSVINVPTALSFFQANHLTITLTFFPSDFPKGFNWRKLVIWHNASPVPYCPTRAADSDCVVSLLLDKATGNVIATIDGPTNGGWGGI
jgi:hypothetical protein